VYLAPEVLMSVGSWFKGVWAWLSCEEPAKAPEPVKEEALAPVSYRDAAPSEPRPELNLYWNIEGDESHPQEVIEQIKAKTRRRATRHFRGKEVRHRVIEKKPDTIRFAFFRRSGTPLKIRWTNKPASP
jgi:hypothetical protein